MQVKEIAITRKGCSFLKKYFESPSYTQNDDFDSPDRNYDYNAPYFRNIQIDKIRGIQPIYQEKINVMNNQIETSGDYERNFNRNRITLITTIKMCN